MDHPELEFFDSLTGELEIQLDQPKERIGTLLNEKAPPDAFIVNIRFNPEVFEEEDSRPLTEEELDSLAFDSPMISLCNDSGIAVTHEAPNGVHFTVRNLIAAIEETERQTRQHMEWIGGIDVNHIYFEGLLLCEDGETYMINWGS